MTLIQIYKKMQIFCLCSRVYFLKRFHLREFLSHFTPGVNQPGQGRFATVFVNTRGRCCSASAEALLGTKKTDLVATDHYGSLMWRQRSAARGTKR